MLRCSLYAYLSCLTLSLLCIVLSSVLFCIGTRYMCYSLCKYDSMLKALSAPSNIDLISKFDLQPLSDRRTVSNSKAGMMYKVINGLADPQPRDGTLQSNLRPSRGQTGTLLIPHTRTDTFWHSFPSAICIWNTLPPSTISDFPDALKCCAQ